MIWAFIRKLFMKGASLEDGIKAFTTANKGITKSDGQKLINIFEDVKKNTATVTDLQKFKDKKGIKSIPVKEQFTTKPNVEDVYFDNPNDPRLFKPNIKPKLSKKERILQIDDELEKLSTGEGKYSKMNRTDRENEMIRLQDESSTLQDQTLFKDSPEAIAKIKAENKAAAKRLRDKKIKSKEPVGLFANEEEFAEDLYSSTQNFIKNDPQFNLELAKTFQKPGVKTYGWTPTGDKSKLLSPQQRQKKLDKLKEIMHHEEYQHQFGESLLDEDGVSILIDDLFRIEKASGGLARVGMFKGGPVWKKFIDGLFIKTSNDIRQGKGKWAGLSQDQWMKQHDDLTKILKKWEMSGKKGLPQGASEYLGMNDLQVSKAIKDATKKVDKDRLATADELEEYESILDPTGVTGDVGEGMTVRELDKMVADHKAYVDDMYQQYKRGDLDKYVKPEVLEEQRLFFEGKINKVLDKAYDDIAGGSGFSDDYKMAADQLSDSIAEQLGKNFDDLAQPQKTQIQNIALKRTTQDLKTKLSQQTAEGIQDGTIDISDPKVAEEFTAFIKKSDPEGFKDLEQKIELESFDVTGRKKNASGGIAGQLHLNEGGRVPMVFGGSAGLKAKIAMIKAALNKGRKDKVKTLFPKYSVEEKELLKLGEKYLPNDAATLAAREIEAKADGIQALVDSLKHDKKLIAEQAKNKAKNDPNLNFLMESLEKTMPDAYGHLKKYTNIDKDILQLETIKKNLIMKDRKLNAEGGRASLSNGGLANILGV